MLLILHHPGDQVVDELAACWSLRRPGIPVCLVTADQLVRGVGWDYHHPNHANDQIRLPGGAVYAASDLTAVFNRLQWLDPPPFPDESDRRYGGSEMFAFMIAALHRLPCPVINPPSPLGPGGNSFGLHETMKDAALVGLATRQIRLVAASRPDTSGWHVHAAPTERFLTFGAELDPRLPVGSRPVVLVEPIEATTTAQVIGSTVVGAPTRLMNDPLRQLARSLQANVLEVEFGYSQRQAQWVVTQAVGRLTSLMPGAVEALIELLNPSEVFA